MYTKENLGSLLLRAGAITEEQLNEALRIAEAESKRLGEVLVQNGYVTEERIHQFLGIQLGYPSIVLERTYLDSAIAKKIPEKFARRYGVIPLYCTETAQGPVVVVAMADPTNIKVKDEIQHALEENIFVAIASPKDIDQTLDSIWNPDYSSATTESEQRNLLPVTEEETKPAIAKILENIFKRALELRANAIHIEPKNKYAGVRFKIDGSYHSITSFPLDTYQAVLARIKILSKIRVGESVISVEEGRFHIREDLAKPVIDVRVTIVPEVFGAKTILRLTRREEIIRPIEQIGFEPEQLGILQTILSNKPGLILISGRYDSGKTTLAYSLLSEVSSKSNMIVTVEDPTAYPISSFNQIKKLINSPDSGNVWEQTLRIVESQDPNIVYMSNVDTKGETAMMLRFASTGRRVIATLYAEDAPSTHWVPFRLGADSYSLAWSYSGVISTRLIRRLCDSCKEETVINEEVLAKLGSNKKMIAGKKIYSATGCEVCNGTGYRGRIGVHEVMPIYDHTKELIESKADSDRIRESAKESGMMSFKEAAICKVIQGLTSLDEIEQFM